MALSLLYVPTLTSIHDYWKNNGFTSLSCFVLLLTYFILSSLCLFLKFNLFILIGGKLLYNIEVVFAIQQHELVMGIHVSPENVIAPHSSTLAWKVPWTDEPGRLWSMGSLRVGHE